LIDLTSVNIALVVVGVLCPVLAVAAWRRLTRLDRYIGVVDKEIELLHSVPMLQPLPLPAIEHLARGLEPVHVFAGQAVFRQGDPADRFYVIEKGRAEVVGDGRLVATLGSGEGFGEIGLLRRVPRTATVRAATDLELYALRCDRFLPVVTGYPPSAREAGTSVETMLGRFSPGQPSDHENGQQA
jgi:Cyclic nucleotide-binding domain